MKSRLPLFFFAITFLSSCEKEPIVLTTTVTTFRESGLATDWDRSGSNRIAYSSKGSDGYYDIYFAMPDGSNDTCLTCNHPNLPNRHVGSASWHPSGDWLMIEVEKLNHPGSSTDALPGFGAYTDVYLISSDRQTTHKIIDTPNDYQHGVIASRFSPDGTKIVWTYRKTAPNVLWPPETFGFWTIKMADLNWSIDSIPSISNIQTFEPDGSAFYECYGFSPDGTKLILCSSVNKPSTWDQQIYTIEIATGAFEALTEKDYNEHAFYTPDGNHIVWMTNKDAQYGGTDWWMMNADGSNKHRLTYFNNPDNNQDMGHAVWAGLGSFSPEGDRFVGGMQLDLISQEGKIVMVNLE